MFFQRTNWCAASFLVGVVWISAAISAQAADDAQPLEKFTAKVAPVLTAKCVTCHRPDNSKGNFQLTTREGMLKGGDSGAALLPGKPEASSLYTRAIPHDGQAPEMPEKGAPLSEIEAVALREWIAAGAPWPEKLVLKEKAKADATFWSLQPVAKREPPFIENGPPGWSSHPIDRFVFAKLKERGLNPSPPADARTFLRRASFDLLGLPPSPEEGVAFERECREAGAQAGGGLPDGQVERLIDRLLKSPHYGERWGRHWLDIAHYADTHGFERDQLRPNAWRYRDYVIQALNEDRPYDTFIRQQIAGDVIAPDDPQSVIATGFLAAGPWDFVGQVEARSDALRRAARAGDLDDIVTQVMAATMGLTVNCARCHDHKLDPILQEDYYRLWAVFAGVKRGDRDILASEAPRLAAEKKTLGDKLAQVRGEIAALAGEGLSLADVVGGGNGKGTGIAGRGIDVRSGKPIAEKVGYLSDLPANRLQKVELGNADEAARFVKWVFVANGKSAVLVDENRPVKGVPETSGHFWDAIRNGPLNAQVNTKLNGIDYASTGHSILGLHANGGITFDLAKLRASAKLKALRLTGVVGFGAGEPAAASRADFTVFVDAELKFQRLKMRKDETAALDIEIPVDATTLTLLATDGGDGIGHDLLFLGDAQLRPAEGNSKLTEADQKRLADLRLEAEKLEQSLRELPTPGKVYAIVSEGPPEVKVLRRGNPEDPLQAVMPGGPSCVTHAPAQFGDASTPEGERRKRLADWITHPANPLTRRVLVNRLWHHHFGQGLVNTPSDFGYGGDRPSHPELLDWLAEEVLRSEWSLKRLHKRIMLSATYRQASASRAAESKADANNRLLWRQNPRRLDAESLRDAVLRASGKLNLEMGGPGYRDFQYTEAYAPIYEYVVADKPELWRRSVYRFVVRTTPQQFLSTLDCPDPANLTPARVTTTTALQALALSNNEFMLRQSEYLAARIKAEAKEPPQQVARAFQLTLQRSPMPDEQTAAGRLVAERGLFALCRALLNANEFVYLD